MSKFWMFALISLHGFTAQAGAALSFQQCVEIVAKNNSAVQAAEESLNSAKSLVESAKGNYLPQITAKLGYSETNNENTNNGTYDGSLNATQNLFNGFADQARVQNAQSRVASAEASLQTAKAQASYDLKSAYAGLAYAKDSIKLSEMIFKRRSENLQMVQLLFENGRENKGSVLLSKANVKQAELDILKAKNAREVNESSLKKVLGMSEEDTIDIQGDVPRINDVEPDYKELVNAAPDRKKALAEIESAEANLTSAKSGFLPTLNLNGSLGRTGQEFFPDDGYGAVGATLSWSLFSGGTDYFSKKSAMALKLVAENNLKSTNLDLLAQMKQAFSTFKEAALELDVSDSFVQAANIRAEITRKKYNNGLSSFDDWEIVENDLITRQKTYTDKKRNRIVSEANWENLQGRGVLP
jgi:outer membrane protein